MSHHKQKRAAVVDIGLAALVVVLLFVPTSAKRHPRYVCSNNGLVVIAGMTTNNDPHDLAVRYCTGDIVAAEKAIRDRYGSVIHQWAFIHLPSSK